MEKGQKVKAVKKKREEKRMKINRKRPINRYENTKKKKRKIRNEHEREKIVEERRRKRIQRRDKKKLKE